MTFKQIITHPGGAHKDDFIACALLVAVQPVPILRREPTAADLADAATCVVDVGHSHDPERLNFDHHQFPVDHPPTCSISLVLQHLGMYEDARNFCEWLEPAEWLDCRGAKTTAQWLGIDRVVLNKLNSPVDISLLRAFSSCQQLQKGEPLWEMMHRVGRDLLDYVRTLQDRLRHIERVSELWRISLPGQDVCAVLFMPRTDPLPENPSLGLERYIESRGWEHTVAGMIYPDSRSPGYGLSRFNDHRQLDFTRLNAEADVHFAHKQGFVAKTRSTDDNRLKELIAKAWIPQPE